MTSPKSSTLSFLPPAFHRVSYSWLRTFLSIMAAIVLSACGQAEDTQQAQVAQPLPADAMAIPSSGPMPPSDGTATPSAQIVTLNRTVLQGSWQGSLVKGRDEYALAFTFTRDQQGEYRAALFSEAMNMYGLPMDSLTFDGKEIVLRSERLAAQFTGSLITNDEGELVRIDGDWFQESELVPVTLMPVENPDV